MIPNVTNKIHEPRAILRPGITMPPLSVGFVRSAGFEMDPMLLTSLLSRSALPCLPNQCCVLPLDGLLLPFCTSNVPGSHYQICFYDLRSPLLLCILVHHKSALYHGMSGKSNFEVRVSYYFHKAQMSSCHNYETNWDGDNGIFIQASSLSPLCRPPGFSQIPLASTWASFHLNMGRELAPLTWRSSTWTCGAWGWLIERTRGCQPSQRCSKIATMM